MYFCKIESNQFYSEHLEVDLFELQMTVDLHPHPHVSNQRVEGKNKSASTLARTRERESYNIDVVWQQVSIFPLSRQYFRTRFSFWEFTQKKRNVIVCDTIPRNCISQWCNTSLLKSNSCFSSPSWNCIITEYELIMFVQNVSINC